VLTTSVGISRVICRFARAGPLHKKNLGRQAQGATLSKKKKLSEKKISSSQRDLGDGKLVRGGNRPLSRRTLARGARILTYGGYCTPRAKASDRRREKLSKTCSIGSAGESEKAWAGFK